MQTQQQHPPEIGNGVIAAAIKAEDACSSGLTRKIGAALLYAGASTLITIVNKSVLTGYGFPSYRFLATCQILATVTALYAAKRLGWVRFPDVGWRTFADAFPMPLIHLGNVQLGLAGTKALSLPTFTVLRRLAIPMTMSGEYCLLGVAADPLVTVSVVAMVIGAVVAAGSDIEFNVHGYGFVFSSNLLTAAHGVFTKRKLNAKKPTMGKCGLMYYSSLFMVPPALLLLYFSDDLGDVYRYGVYSYLMDNYQRRIWESCTPREGLGYHTFFSQIKLKKSRKFVFLIHILL